MAAAFPFWSTRYSMTNRRWRGRSPSVSGAGPWAASAAATSCSGTAGGTFGLGGSFALFRVSTRLRFAFRVALAMALSLVLRFHRRRVDARGFVQEADGPKPRPGLLLAEDVLLAAPEVLAWAF